MKRDDFTAHTTRNGYMIYYKGKAIGGAGTLETGKRVHYKIIAKDIAMYRQQAEGEIQQLLNNHGQQRFIDEINKIDKEATL